MARNIERARADMAFGKGNMDSGEGGMVFGKKPSLEFKNTQKNQQIESENDRKKNRKKPRKGNPATKREKEQCNTNHYK